MAKRMLRTLLASLALAACWRRPVPELRIGINPWPGYEYLYLAQERGLFDTTVARIRLLEFSSLSDTRRAYERGQLDGFAGTMTEMLQARERSPRRPVAVLATDYSSGGDVVITRGGLSSVESLRGRRVGAEMKSDNIYLLGRALQSHGIHLSDLTVVPLDNSQMPAAFRAGEVDAVVTSPPVSIELLRMPESHIVFSSRQIPNELVDVIAVDSVVIARHGDAVSGMLVGFERAREFARAHRDEAYAVMAAREGITAAEFEAAVESDIRLIPADRQEAFLRRGGQIDDLGLQAANLLLSVGQLSHRPVLTGLTWFRSSSVSRPRRVGRFGPQP